MFQQTQKLEFFVKETFYIRMNEAIKHHKPDQKYCLVYIPNTVH